MAEQAVFPPPVAPAQNGNTTFTSPVGIPSAQPSNGSPASFRSFSPPQEAAPQPSTLMYEVVDAQTGEVLSGSNLPAAFIRPQLVGIKMLNQARDYRALCDKASGFFSCNEISKGGAIKMRILNWRLEQGVRLSDVYPEPETVVQVVFIDEQNLISTVLFRTSSMRNFIQLIDNITAEGYALASLVVTAVLERVTTKSAHTFHIVKFKYEPNDEQNIREIIAFVQSSPQALNCFRDLPREVVNMGGYAEGVAA